MKPSTTRPRSLRCRLHSRLSVLVSACALALYGMFAFAAPAQASSSVSVSATTVAAGDTFTVSFTGTVPNDASGVGENFYSGSSTIGSLESFTTIEECTGNSDPCFRPDYGGVRVPLGTRTAGDQVSGSITLRVAPDTPAGTFVLRYQLASDTFRDATQDGPTITVTTGNSLSVTNPGDQTSTAGTPVSLQIQAADPAPGQTLTYSANGLPTGLSINSGTGLISGTPTTVATSAVTVTATDTAGATGSASFSWAVVAPTCRVTYRQFQYFPPVAGARFYAVAIGVTNTSDAAIPGRWKLKFTFNEDRGIFRTTNGYVTSPTNGRNMTVTEDRGRDINPHRTAALGIYTYGRDTSSFAPPNTFTLNGTTCEDNIT